MSIKQKIFVTIGIIVIIGVSFVVGLLVGQKNVSNNDTEVSKVYSQTFYANIQSIKQYNDGSIHLNVKGLNVNDIHYRGYFTFKVDDNIDIIRGKEKIKVSDLAIGDNISITFTDEIINSVSPTPLQEVVKVQLLNEVNNKVTTIDIEETGLSSVAPAKKYTLNQEEIYTIFNIIDNLTFSKETCDGTETYFIKYNSEEEDGFITYGIEVFDDEYHITSEGRGEAILSSEQREQLKQILNKIHD